MQVLLCVLALVAYANAWANMPCGSSACPVQITNIHFGNPNDALITIGFKNNAGNEYKGPGGNLVIETEGYGCMFVFCSWAKGPTMNNKTCDWGLCDNGNFLNPGQSKEKNINFDEALKQAYATSGCCEVNTGCDCMIRGVATWRDAQFGEICKVSMAFKCDLKNRNKCVVSTKFSSEEGDIIAAAEN